MKTITITLTTGLAGGYDAYFVKVDDRIVDTPYRQNKTKYETVRHLAELRAEKTKTENPLATVIFKDEIRDVQFTL